MSLSEIVERFERIKRDDPARTLVHVPGSGVSLAAEDLGQISRVFGDRLAASGLGPDRLLLVASGNRAATIALWLACRALDIPVMPVDQGTPAAEMRVLAE